MATMSNVMLYQNRDTLYEQVFPSDFISWFHFITILYKYIYIYIYIALKMMQTCFYYFYTNTNKVK